MQNKIDAYRQKNHYLAILKDIAKTADGKSLKWLHSKLLKYDIYLHFEEALSFYHRFYISNSVNMDSSVSGGRVILHLFQDEWLENGKVVASKLIEAIDTELQYNSKDIKLMEQNERDKDKLINKYNSLVDELNTLTKSMSMEFIKEYRKEFKSISILIE